MTGKYQIVTVFLVATGLLTGCSALPSGFSNKVERIDRGQKFGVSIGMSRQDAQKQLMDSTGAQLWFARECPSSSDCEGAHSEENYRVKGGLTGGTISLYFTDAKVSKILWYQNPLDP